MPSGHPRELGSLAQNDLKQVPVYAAVINLLQENIIWANNDEIIPQTGRDKYSKN
jgi:hypothetical protein